MLPTPLVRMSSARCLWQIASSLAVLLSATTPLASSVQASETDLVTDEAAIRQVVYEELSDPNKPPVGITVDVILDHYSRAVWFMEHAGGMMILERQESGAWAVICGDGGVLDAAAMMTYCGMSQPDAAAMLAVEGAPLLTAQVYDPPSNVRQFPNGEILCAVSATTSIRIFGENADSWYVTDVCGEMGVIHASQIRF